MTNRYDQIVEKFAKDKNIPQGEGYFSLGECSICGTVALLEVDGEKPRDVDVSPLGKDCPNCGEVQRRNPEMFMWVLNTLSKMRNDLLNELSRNTSGE